MTKQLLLGLNLRDDATFANFAVGDNQQIVSALQNLLSSKQDCMIYLWGHAASGKTHLLHALCHLASEQQYQAFYLPLASCGVTPEILQDLEQYQLVVLDDVGAICGKPDWEEALFHFYNRARDVGTKLIVTAKQAPQQLALQLPDLQSRMTWGLTYHLTDLNEEDKLTALNLHANARGINLNREIGQFLLRRCNRDMHALMQVLEQLDKASLQEKRRLTIPFVKSVLML